MKLNIGSSQKNGNPGTSNPRGGKKDMRMGPGVPTGNLAKSQAKGNPGVSNPRKGKVAMPNTLDGNSYGSGGPRGDKAVMSGKAKTGNPGVSNPRGGRVSKHEMFMG